MSRLSEMRQQRIEKLRELRKMGFQPFPAQSSRSHNTQEVTEHFEALEGEAVTVAGRMMTLRDHGHLVFIDLQDQSGTIQLYIKDDELQPSNVAEQTLGFTELRLLDVGDFIEATGSVTKTQRGQISIQPTTLKLLSKSIRPLPDKWDGVKDPEIIFRRRYVDFAINPERRQLFERKARFWSANRQFMQEHGFIEVETPVLEHVTGGADARPFITHMNALDQNFFLRISTELYQKRLIGGGFEKVYTIGPNFRNEGLSDEHLPEYYQIEWYWAYADFRDNMRLVEALFKYIALSVYGKTIFTKNEHTFDLAQDWPEISYPDVIKERFGIDIFTATEAEMLAIVQQHKVKLDGTINRQRLIDNIWKLIRKTISGPAFLINEPKFMSPLAKSRIDRPELTERFHIIIAGSELGNGYSELNDPLDQMERFQEQQSARDEGDDEAQMLDIDFVEMLEYGMPPTSGFGMSERVFWFLENVTAREGTLFPQLKHKIEPMTQELYGLKDPSAPASKKRPASTASAPNKKSAESEATTALPPREQAEKLLETYISNEALRHHSRMVAQAMQAYAQELGEDPELWYQTGLLHDLDWEQFPEEHPNHAIEVLLLEYPEELKQAIAAHAPDRTGKEPETVLEKHLFANDELSGIMHAVSLMRPNGFADMEAKSVKKKLKDKSFAANVSRSDIDRGVELIEKSADDHITFLIGVFRN
ncbi:MAG: lysine--tRNA ligase [bacterium]|nr:lysine--tRNA ligase [bacterium]